MGLGLLHRRELLPGALKCRRGRVAPDGRALRAQLPASDLQERPPIRDGVGGLFIPRPDTPAAGRRLDERVKYAEVLTDHVVHQICADYGAPEAAWLQEDLAPCHAAKASKEVKQQLGLRVLPWVGQIPDLNPIENAWVELERRLRARPTAPKNKDELFAALSEGWEAILAFFFRRLVESMPRRVRDVIAVGGASTKY